MAIVKYINYNSKHLEMLKLMGDKDRLQVMDATINYGIDGKLPQDGEMGLAAAIVFKYIKDDIDTYNTNYLKKIEEHRENGKKGGRPKKAMVISENHGFLQKTEGFSENPNIRYNNVKYSNVSSSYGEEEEEDSTLEGIPTTGSKLPAKCLELLETDIEKRRDAFAGEVFTEENMKKYDKSRLDDFYAHFVPVTENGLMLFEDMRHNPQKGRRGTFDVSAELYKWMKHGEQK